MAVPLNQGVRRRIRQAWWKMLFHPTQTMEALLVEKKDRGWLKIGALMGIGQLANAPMLYPTEETSVGAVFSWIIILGPVVGWGLLLVGGWISWKLGRLLFGGSGDIKAIRLSLAWGALPLIWSLAFWVPCLLAYWGPAFYETLGIFRPVFAGITLWTLITLTRALAVAHQFKVLYAFLTLILTFSIVSFPLSLFLGPPL